MASSASAFNYYYRKLVPRFIRCIKWNSHLEEMKARGFNYGLPLVLIPLYFWHSPTGTSYHSRLFILGPYFKSDEDRLALKRDTTGDIIWDRDFEIDQYYLDMKPRYDMSERRLAYPQYYAGRYDGFKKDRV